MSMELRYNEKKTKMCKEFKVFEGSFDKEQAVFGGLFTFQLYYTLANIKATNSKNIPIFNNILIVLKYLLSKLLIKVRIKAKPITIDPKIMGKRNSIELIILVKIGRIKKSIAKI